MPICNESCLSPAAESSWLCPPLSVCQKRSSYPRGSLTKYQFNSLWFCHLVLWAWWISSGNLPFVCPLAGHVQLCLLTCYSYSWLDAGFNRSGTHVSTFSSIVIWRTDGKWKLPDMLERRWLRRAEQHLGNRSPACKVDCVRKQLPQFAFFLSTGKVRSPPGKAIPPRAISDSELKHYWGTAAHGAFAMTICRD